MHDLFELRRSKGIEQQEMAEHLGIHKTTLSQIERGRSELTLIRATQYAGKLQVSLQEVSDAAVETRRRWQEHQKNPKPRPQKRRKAA
jgi:transcriptional regulator with XRE-family HTH domain